MILEVIFLSFLLSTYLGKITKVTKTGYLVVTVIIFFLTLTTTFDSSRSRRHSNRLLAEIHHSVPLLSLCQHFLYLKKFWQSHMKIPT